MLERNRNVWLFIAAITCVATACSRTPEPRVCTQIGCNSGLIVELPDVPSPYTVSVRVPGQDRPARVAECGPDRPCTGSEFFADYTPDVVEIQVTAAGDSRTEVFRPEYESVRPNGPGCPPVCRQATVVFNW